MIVASSLSERERRRLAKLQRLVQRGVLRFLLRVALAGACGGLLFAGAMRLFAPCFGCQPLLPPTGVESHAMLERLVYELVSLFGPFGGFSLLCMLLFVSVFLPIGVRAWRLQRRAYEELCARDRAASSEPR